MKFDKNYWESKYHENKTGWDIGTPSTPIKTYIDQIKNKNLKILVPGAGNGYEVEYLHLNGFNNVYVIDIAAQPLKNLHHPIPKLFKFFKFFNLFENLSPKFFEQFPTLKHLKLSGKLSPINLRQLLTFNLFKLFGNLSPTNNSQLRTYKLFKLFDKL